MGQTRNTKVAKFQILKPAAEMGWDELGELLRQARYRVFRLANLAVSEAYLSFHLWRTGRADKYKTATIDDLNKRLRKMLIEEEREETTKGRRKNKMTTSRSLTLDSQGPAPCRPPSSVR